MTGGVNIPIAADASSVIAEAGKTGVALEDVVDSLDDVAQSSETNADRINRSLDQVGQQARATGDDIGQRVESGTDDAARAGDQLERRMRDSLDAVRTSARRTGDDIGEDVSRGTREASEGTETLRENADSNAKEVAASFDGSAQSIADGFQGLAAEAFEGFGPAGLAAGVAVAAGIGLISAASEKAKEQAQETAEAIADITGELIDLGSLKLDDASVLDNLKEAATTANDGKVTINEWAAAARAAGIDFTTFARGMAGDSEALQASYADVTAKQQALADGLDGFVTSYTGAGDAATVYYAQTYDVAHALDDARKSLEQQDGTLNQASDTTRLFNEATRGLTETTVDNTAATEEAKRVQDAYGQALESAADPVGVYNDVLAKKEAADRSAAEKTAAATKDSKDSWADYAKGAKVSVGDLIKTWNDQAKAAEDFTTNLATIAAAGGQALADELRQKGPEVAGAVAETIAEASPKKQQQAIEAHARATGQALTDSMASGVTGSTDTLQRSVTDAVNGVTVPDLKVGVDTTALDEAMNQIQRRKYHVNIAPRVGQPVPG